MISRIVVGAPINRSQGDGGVIAARPCVVPQVQRHRQRRGKPQAVGRGRGRRSRHHTTPQGIGHDPHDGPAEAVGRPGHELGQVLGRGLGQVHVLLIISLGYPHGDVPGGRLQVLLRRQCAAQQSAERRDSPDSDVALRLEPDRRSLRLRVAAGPGAGGSDLSLGMFRMDSKKISENVGINVVIVSPML